MIKKALFWLGIAFLIFFVAFNPATFTDAFGQILSATGHFLARLVA